MRCVGLTLFVLVVAPDAVDAGATVQFICNPQEGLLGECCARPNSVITVDVQIVQDAGGSDQRLRMVEFDFAGTSPLLELNFPTTHDRGTPDPADDIRFWRFDSLPGCQLAGSYCGFNHLVDFEMGSGPVDTRERVASTVFFGTAADETAQLLLPGGNNPRPVTVARFEIRTPSTPGEYILSLMNQTSPDPNRRARIDFGFNPHPTWRAGSAAPNNLSGGVTVVRVADFACHGDPCEVFLPSLVSSVPSFTPVGVSTVPQNGTLWRSRNNVIRLVFSWELHAPAPAPGEIVIREALGGIGCGPGSGRFGEDLADRFSYTIEPPNVLRIEERGSVLRHRTWIAVTNGGRWGETCPFTVYFPIQVGDATGDSRVLQADSGFIASAIPCVVGCGDQNRRDIDGDRRVLQADVGEAASRVSSLPVGKPCGH